MAIFLYLAAIAVYFIYKWAVANHDFFEKQGIPFIKPLPLLGSNAGIYFKKQPFVVSMMNDYNKFKNEK